MNYHTDLLKEAKKLRRLIVECYQRFNINIIINRCQLIPALQRYIFNIEIIPETKVQDIFTHAQDIQVTLGLHLFYPFKEGISIRLAVSKFDTSENRLLKILSSSLFSKSDMKIPLAIGYDLTGNMHIVDLIKLHHLLIIGPTGTGKSVALQCIVTSIITKCPVSHVNLLMLDIESNSLSLFDNLLHLSGPIIKDYKMGIYILERLVSEMYRRISLGEKECEHLPFIVCIIDEYDSTIDHIDNKKDVQKFINVMNTLLWQSRKAKIIMILATHDPTLKNTKIAVNEIVARIVFQSAKPHNSTAALGTGGADKLPEKGAMIFKSQSEMVTLQGSNVTPDEIIKILSNAPITCDDSNKLCTESRYPAM